MIGRRAFLSCLLAVAASSRSRAGENYFSGKTITYIVATKPGGGYDTMGRLVAKYLEAHLPGSRIVVKNIAGAGHMVGCQTIYSSEADGLTIGTFNTALIYSQLTGAMDSTLDLGKMSWIGKASSESRVIVSAATSGINDLDDLKTKDRVFRVAAGAKGTAAHVDAMLIARTFGYNFKPVFGFEGTDTELAMLRGEIDLVVSSRSSMETFVAAGSGRFLVEFGGAPGSALPNGDALPKTDAGKAVVSLIEDMAKFSRLTAGPPDIPADRLALLRAAYLAALSDPGFLAEAKTLNLPISPAPGEVVAERIAAALKPSPEIRTIITDLLK